MPSALMKVVAVEINRFEFPREVDKEGYAGVRRRSSRGGTRGIVLQRENDAENDQVGKGLEDV